MVGKLRGGLGFGRWKRGWDEWECCVHRRGGVGHGAVPAGFRLTEDAADEGCDVTDKAQWRKANPALDEGYMNEGALDMAVAMSPESHFRIFRLGQWHEGTECWLGDDGKKVWDELEQPFTMVDGEPVWVGVDVALKHDLSLYHI